MKSNWTACLLSMPAVLFVGALFLAPVFQLLLSSVIAADGAGHFSITLAPYRAFFASAHNFRLIARTCLIGGVTVIACFVLAFPVALFMRQIAPRWRSLLAIALLSPLLTSVVVRTLAWVMLLGPKGLFNNILTWAGWSPLPLMYNDFGVIVGLTHVFFGYMLLSIMTSVLKIDGNLLLAAANLGATRLRILTRIILPLSMPGIAAGAILVFTMSSSAYVTPILLGGANTKVLSTEIYDLAVNYLEWREAAVMAAVLFALVWCVVALLSRAGDKNSRRTELREAA